MNFCSHLRPTQRIGSGKSHLQPLRHGPPIGFRSSTAPASGRRVMPVGQGAVSHHFRTSGNQDLLCPALRGACESPWDPFRAARVALPRSTLSVPSGTRYRLCPAPEAQVPTTPWGMPLCWDESFPKAAASKMIGRGTAGCPGSCFTLRRGGVASALGEHGPRSGHRRLIVSLWNPSAPMESGLNLTFQICLSLRFGKVLQRIPKHNSRHGPIMLSKKLLLTTAVALSHFPQHPAYGFVYQVVPIVK